MGTKAGVAMKWDDPCITQGNAQHRVARRRLLLMFVSIHIYKNGTSRNEVNNILDKQLLIQVFYMQHPLKLTLK